MGPLNRINAAYAVAMTYAAGCLGFLVLTVSAFGASVPAVLFGALPMAGLPKVDRWFAKQTGAPRKDQDAVAPTDDACGTCERWCLRSTELDVLCVCGCEAHAEAERL